MLAGSCRRVRAVVGRPSAGVIGGGSGVSLGWMDASRRSAVARAAFIVEACGASSAEILAVRALCSSMWRWCAESSCVLALAEAALRVGVVELCGLLQSHNLGDLHV